MCHWYHRDWNKRAGQVRRQLGNLQRDVNETLEFVDRVEKRLRQEEADHHSILNLQACIRDEEGRAIQANKAPGNTWLYYGGVDMD